MAHDLVIRGGTIVDGTGVPGATGDVAIDGDRLTQVGGRADAGEREIDADGLVVAPGFVDPHTHYDAQICWDPALTPSCWNGITSVVMGNCGFTLAPCHPEHREHLMRMLERVEGMSGRYQGGFQCERNWSLRAQNLRAQIQHLVEHSGCLAARLGDSLRMMNYCERSGSRKSTLSRSQTFPFVPCFEQSRATGRDSSIATDPVNTTGPNATGPRTRQVATGPLATGPRTRQVRTRQVRECDRSRQLDCDRPRERDRSEPDSS